MGPCVKSTLINILTAMIGRTNTVATTRRELHSNPFEVYCLHNKKLILINDSAYFNKDLDIVKALVGMDFLRARKKHSSRVFDYKVQRLMIVVGNQPLGVIYRDTSGARFRRMMRALPAELKPEKWDEALLLKGAADGYTGTQTSYQVSSTGLMIWTPKKRNRSYQILRNP